MREEFIWVLRLDVVGLQRRCREIGQIEGDNDVSTRANRGSQNMAVVGVGELQDRNKTFVSGYQAVMNMGIHQLSCAIELFRLQVGPVCKQITRPLIVDGICPFRPKHSGYGQADEQISQGSWVKNASVIYCCESPQV